MRTVPPRRDDDDARPAVPPRKRRALRLAAAAAFFGYASVALAMPANAATGDILDWSLLSDNLDKVFGLVIVIAGLVMIARSQRSRFGDVLSTAAIILIGAIVAGVGVGWMAWGGKIGHLLTG